MSFQSIEHVFVLMLENRSFDHIFGFSNLSGRDATTGEPTRIDGLSGSEIQIDSNGEPHAVVMGAPSTLGLDLPHEFSDVKRQLCGAGHDAGAYCDADVKNIGFLLRSEARGAAAEDAICCFAPDELPILHALAQEFVVCDRWFSSVPGATFPNRMFAHAGTSGGVANTPSRGSLALAATICGYDFTNGHIFGRLRGKNLDWAVYAHDIVENMTVLLDGIFPHQISEYSYFEENVCSPGFSTQYTFIEPQYGAIAGNYARGNSMHPLNDVRRGEQLIKSVYESIRRSPAWPRSVLIITFDEHGGFYDHVPPPAAEAPGDGSESDASSFTFNRLGVRVPAVVVSPLIPRNIIDHTVYDHTTILKTLSRRFQLGYLTNRDRSANSLEHLFTLSAARDDAPMTLPDALPVMSPMPIAMAPAEAPALEVSDSAKPFALGAVMAEAKIKGPAEWPSIEKKGEELDAKPASYVAHYLEEVRDRSNIEREALEGPEPGSLVADGDTEQAGPAQLAKTSQATKWRAEYVRPLQRDDAERALKSCGGDLGVAAWSLRISRAELRDLLKGPGPADGSRPGIRRSRDAG